MTQPTEAMHKDADSMPRLYTDGLDQMYLDDEIPTISSIAGPAVHYDEPDWTITPISCPEGEYLKSSEVSTPTKAQTAVNPI